MNDKVQIFLLCNCNHGDLSDLTHSLADVQFVDTKKIRSISELIECIEEPLQSANILIICDGDDEFASISEYVQSKRTSKEKVRGYCIYTKNVTKNNILKDKESKVIGVYGELEKLQHGIIEFLSQYQYKIEKANLKQQKKLFLISKEEENLKNEQIEFLKSTKGEDLAKS